MLMQDYFLLDQPLLRQLLYRFEVLLMLIEDSFHFEQQQASQLL